MSAAPTSFQPAEPRSRQHRSNSFNFVPVRDVPRGAGEPCPVRRSEEAFEPARSVFLRIRGAMRLFRTSTTDFTDDEVALATRGLGQLYADVSRKRFPDDFERDLRKLVLSEECLACAKRASCGGCFRASQENPFTRDRLDVEAALGAMSGAILDVGCGDGPYLRALESRVTAGAARYLGLDPDAGRIRLLRARHPWAGYFEGDLDALAATGELGSFDHVLMLRSFNHLPDVDRAVTLAVGLLRPGGTLLVVDNVAFGLVRSAEQAASAEAGPATFEHVRNDGAEDADRRVGRPGLTLRRRRVVTPGGSNEWLLHYEKTGDLPS